MKKALSKAKNNTNIHGNNLIISPLFDVEQMKRDVAFQMELVANQMPKITEMLKWQAPFIADAVKQANEAARLYHDLVVNTGIIDQMAKMHVERKKLEESLKNVISLPQRGMYIHTEKSLIAPIREEKLLEVKDEIIEKIADRVFQKMLEKEKSENTFIEKDVPIIVLPKEATWQSLTLALCEDQQIEIYYKDKFVDKVSYAKIGFSMGNTNENKNNQQGEFLEKLSILQMNDTYAHEATKEKMMQMLHIEKEQLLFNIKSEMSGALREALIDDIPFENYKKYGYYKPKFKLKPLPEFRGDGELYINPSGFIEDYDPKAKLSKRSSSENEF